MPTLLANNIMLYYEVAGQGQTLAFIHGLGSSTRDWEFQIPAFSKKYQVVTFDLRGHGQSAKPAGPYTIEMFTDDLAGLLTGMVLAGPLFQLFGPTAFFLNALLYLLSFVIFRFGVRRDAEPEPAAAAQPQQNGFRLVALVVRERRAIAAGNARSARAIGPGLSAILPRCGPPLRRGQRCWTPRRPASPSR